MGNCVQSGRGGGGAFAGQAGRLVLRSGGSGKDEEGHGASAPSVVKVKMVLTKEELGWLVAGLKAGDRRLEDVLDEMARKRDGRDGWRPSLESIVECPAETTEAAAVVATGSSDD